MFATIFKLHRVKARVATNIQARALKLRHRCDPPAKREYLQKSAREMPSSPPSPGRAKAARAPRSSITAPGTKIAPGITRGAASHLGSPLGRRIYPVVINDAAASYSCVVMGASVRHMRTSEPNSTVTSFQTSGLLFASHSAVCCSLTRLRLASSSAPMSLARICGDILDTIAPKMRSTTVDGAFDERANLLLGESSRIVSVRKPNDVVTAEETGCRAYHQACSVPLAAIPGVSGPVI